MPGSATPRAATEITPSAPAGAPPKAPRAGRARGWLVTAIVFLAIAGGWFWWFHGPKFWTDGEALRFPDAPHAVRAVAWQPPKPLVEINTPDQEYEPAVSPEGDELYFVRGKATRNADIYLSYRRGGAWTEPAPVEALNSGYDDLGPRVTSDGRFLLFYSNRPGGIGGYDIWAAPRLPAGGGSGWGTPFNLGPLVNSEYDEYSPAPTPDGKRLFFATNRKAEAHEQKEAWRATIRLTASMDFDLWMADLDEQAAAAAVLASAAPSTRPTTEPTAAAGDGADFGNADSTAAPTTGPSTRPATAQAVAPAAHSTDRAAFPAQLVYHPASEVPGVNTPFTEGASCLSPDGRFLYFASNRPGGYGKFDLYRCRITSGAFGEVENLGPSINTSDNEADPQLALSGFRLYFSSDRVAGGGRYNGYDLMQSDSVEVYAERQARNVPALGVSWWVLLASLLLLLPLVMFMRRWDSRHFNLLQRCLLVSLLVHVLLLVGFSFKRVASDFPRVAKELGISEAIVNLGPSSEARQAEVGLSIRQQSSSDLPVALAPAGELTQSKVGAEIVAAKAQGVQVNVPQAGAGEPKPLEVQAAAPKIDKLEMPPAPRPDPVAPQVRPGPELLDLKVVAAAPRIARPEAAVPQPDAVAATTPKTEVTVPAPVAPPAMKIDAAPAAVANAGGSLAEQAGPARPAVPDVKPTDVGPKALDADAMATAAPSVAAPRPAQAERIVTKGPDGPAAGEMTATAARQGTPAAGSSGPVDVRAALPAVGEAGRGPGESMASAVGATPRANVAGGAVQSDVPGPNLPSSFKSAPEITGPAPNAIRVATGRPDAPAAAEIAGNLDRQSTTAGGSSGAAAVDVKAPAAPAGQGAGESLANAVPVAAGKPGAIAANVVPGATVDGVGIGTGVGVPDLGMRTPGTRRHADEASPLAAVAEGLTPTTRPASSGIASATGAGGAKEVSVSAPTVAAKSDAAAGSLASAAVAPTSRPSTALAASPLTGPTVGQPTGPIFASTAGEPVVEGPRVAKAPIATGAAEPSTTTDQAIAAAHKMDSGTTAAAGSGAAQVGGVRTSVPAAAATGTESLASAASVGARPVGVPSALAAAPALTGTGTGPGLPGVEGPQVSAPKIAAAPMHGTGQGSPSGTGTAPGGGPDGGPLVSRRSNPPGEGVGVGRPAPRGSVTIPDPGTAFGPGPGGSGGSGPSSALARPRTIEGPVVAVTPQIDVTLPKVATPGALFQRAPEQRRPLVEKMGGNQESEKAVDRGLAYLARQQEPEGRWTMVMDDGRPGRRPRSQHDMACTGLAVLAFLAADHSPAKAGPYKQIVTDGLEFLLDHQGDDGDLRGPREFRGGGSDRANLYDQGIATMALAEAALMTGDKRYTDAAFKAADFILACQNPDTGGWRYVPGDPGDTSVLGWQLLALHDCELAGYQVPDQTKDRALQYIRSVSRGRNKVLASYQASRAPDPVMTAEALFGRMLLNDPVSDAAAREASKFLITDLPPRGGIDLYYWYYASLCLSQMQNDAWKRWNEQTRDTLIRLQRHGGSADGAWVEDRYAARAGRIYTTALATLTLEVYYRYLPLNPENTGKGNGAAQAEPKPEPAKAPRPVLEPN